MHSTARAGYYYFVYCILYTTFWKTLGLAVTTFVPDAATANLATSLLISMILSYSGILQPPSLIPHFWKFMYRISLITYFLQSLLGNVLHDGKVHCAQSEFNIFNPPPWYTCFEYAGSQPMLEDTSTTLMRIQIANFANGPSRTSIWLKWILVIRGSDGEISAWSVPLFCLIWHSVFLGFTSSEL
ncbi:hypothetical protein V1527DRAFT_71248 [Lipomyces starkeyi]